MTSHIGHVADKMAGWKRLSDCDSDCASSSVPEKKIKCQPSVNTLERWQGQYKKEHSCLLSLLFPTETAYSARNGASTKYM